MKLKPRAPIAGCVASLALALVLSASAPATAAPVPLAQFGSAGSDAGQLSNPRGVVLDGAGNLYVSDPFNSRTSVFGADGTFIRAFGWGVDTGAAAFEVCTTASTCQAGISGGGAGQLAYPVGVALDDAGRLYVGDANNDRISVFDTAGPSFIRAFGWGVDTGAAAFEVCTTASTCQAGISGGGAGQVSSPEGAALDAAGRLYFGDADRISVFDTTGPSFIRAFGWGVDTGAAAFEVCTTASTCQAGLSGGGAGQLNSPYSVALDGAGGLYVADTSNDRISVFDSTGPSFTRAFGWGVDTGAAAFEVCTTASTCQQGISGGGAGQIDGTVGIGAGGGGDLFVTEQSNYRTSVFGTAAPSFTRAFGWGVDTGAAAFEICTMASTCQAGISGGGAGQFSQPAAVATDCRGAAWVVDSNLGRLERVGEPGTPLPPCPPQTTIASGPGGPTNDKTPTFTFSSSAPGSSFECRVDGAAFAACSGPGASHTTIALADGPHTFAVRATDPAANTDPTPATRAFTVDTRRPVTRITKKPRKKLKTMKAKAKVRVSFTSEGGATFKCRLDKLKLKRCRSPFIVKARSKGGKGKKHTISVQATDGAGNVGKPAAVKFTLIRKG